MCISAAKISDDIFLVIDQIFHFFSQIFPIFAMLNFIFDPFLTRKTPFFTLFIFSRTSDSTTSLNIGGPMHGPSPTSNFGGQSPVSPRSPPLALVNLRVEGYRPSSLSYSCVQCTACDIKT